MAKYLVRKLTLETLRDHGGVDSRGDETSRRRADEAPPLHYWITSSVTESKFPEVCYGMDESTLRRCP